DLAMQFLHHLLHNGQSGPSAFELLLPYQPVKESKNAVVVFHVKTDAVIRNHDLTGIGKLLAGYINVWRPGVSAVLEGIVDQIGQNLQEAALPSTNTRQGKADGHFGALLENHRLPVPENGLNQV